MSASGLWNGSLSFKKSIFSGSIKRNFYWISFCWFVFIPFQWKQRAHTCKNTSESRRSVQEIPAVLVKTGTGGRRRHILSASPEATAWVQETPGCFGSALPSMSTQTGQIASWRELRCGDMDFYLMGQVNTKALRWEGENPSKRTRGVTWSWGFGTALVQEPVRNVESPVPVLQYNSFSLVSKASCTSKSCL